jgi:1-acyl-sn-glycerol-3-phosphate acyltransferase
VSWSPPTKPPSRLELAFYQLVRVILVGFSRLYLPGRVLGRENLPTSGAFIVAPVHRSYVDWLIVARITRRRMRYIAKAELWKSKITGRLLEALGCFPVNRSGADREALERCREVLMGGEPLVMFPEGTRRSGPVVEDLREGVAYLALRAGVPVIPIGIGGSERSMPRGSHVPRPRFVEVVIGKPVVPDEAGPAVASAGPGSENAGTPAGGVVAEEGTPAPAKPARVSRKATKAFSDLVGSRIQEVFDEADHLAKVR